VKPFETLFVDHNMQKAILILTLFLIPAAPLFAQQNDDDPFRRDPIFTRPLEDFFGIQDERDEREKEARDRKQ